MLDRLLAYVCEQHPDANARLALQEMAVASAWHRSVSDDPLLSEQGRAIPETVLTTEDTGDAEKTYTRAEGRIVEAT